jgi:hypothetical protein
MITIAVKDGRSHGRGPTRYLCLTTAECIAALRRGKAYTRQQSRAVRLRPRDDPDKPGEQP